AERALQPAAQRVERVGLALEECSESLFGALADTFDGGHCEFGLAAWEVMVEAALGHIGGGQQFAQANAVQAFALQGIDHAVDEFVASGPVHGLDYLDRSV